HCGRHRGDIALQYKSWKRRISEMSWKSQRLPQVRGGDSKSAQLGAVSTWSFQLDPGEKGQYFRVAWYVL
ncbi:unnamed protein product, partial [Penicillium nalgiovense]